MVGSKKRFPEIDASIKNDSPFETLNKSSSDLISHICIKTVAPLAGRFQVFGETVLVGTCVRAK